MNNGRLILKVTLHEDEDPDLIDWLRTQSRYQRGKALRVALRAWRTLKATAPANQSADSFSEKTVFAGSKANGPTDSPGKSRNPGGRHPGLEDLPDFDPLSFKFGDTSPTH